MSAVESVLQEIVEPARAMFEVELGIEGIERLIEFTGELLKWNARINLTAITEPEKIAELHILDSLAISPHLPRGAHVLDIGTGGGFPGVPIAIARPDLRLTLVDRTEKKILFLKTTLARLDVRNASALHARAQEGADGGLPTADVVVSRALTAPDAWFPMARTYTRPGGRIIAMLGSSQPTDQELDALCVDPGDEIQLLRYTLPGGAQRALAILQLAEG